MKIELKIVISDIKTYHIMSNNKNYMDRLLEAYEYLKREKLNTYQKFMTSDNNIVGLFDYYEITIFDRLRNEEYNKLIRESWEFIHKDTDRYIENLSIGDELASYGRLGYTPKRREFIEKGIIVTGLTDEEEEYRKKR